MRWLAFLLLLAVLPTAELTEQLVHVIDHVVAVEAADHSAHHDDSQRDEHGCTGLVHLCACHHAQATAGVPYGVKNRVVAARSPDLDAPISLISLTSPEPAQRPPIV